MGREKKNRKTNRYDIRLTDDEMKTLDDLSKRKQIPKSAIIRDALRIYNNLSKYG